MKLNELIGMRKDLKEDIYLERIKIHKDFVSANRKTLMLLDILLILGIIFNFGAVFMTDYLLHKDKVLEAKDKGEEIVYREVNQIQAKLNNYETAKTPEEVKQNFTLLFALLKQSFIWAIFLGFYIFKRSSMVSKYDYFWLIFIVSFFFTTIGYDFFHDLGLVVADVLYGY